MLSLKIAVRLILKRPIQNLIIFLTIIISVSAQLFVVNISASLNNMVDNIFINNNTYLHLNNETFLNGKRVPIHYNNEINNYLDANPLIKNYTYTSGSVNLIEINGVKNENTFRIDLVNDPSGFVFFEVDQYLNAGRLPENNEEIVILDTFAKQENLTIGDKFTFPFATFTVEYEIVGTFKENSYHVNSNRGYTLSKTQNFTAIRISLFDKEDTEEVYNYLKEFAEEKNFSIHRWDEVLEIYQVIEKAMFLVLIFIQIFLSLIVFFIIASVLRYTVSNLTSQIGILKALGLKHRKVKNIFLIKTTILLFLGIIVGIVFNNIGLKIFQKIMTTDEGVKRLDVIVNRPIFLISILVIVITVTVSTIYSIRKTKEIKIIEVIKGGN